jgi:hypothetical protein
MTGNPEVMPETGQTHRNGLMGLVLEIKKLETPASLTLPLPPRYLRRAFPAQFIKRGFPWPSV